MALPRRIRKLVKLSPLTLLLLAGMLFAGPATAEHFSPFNSRHDRDAERGEVKVALAGPRQVVVRDLPPAAVTGTERAREVLGPRRFPPEWTTGPLSPAPMANAADSAFSAESEANTPPALSTGSFEGLDNDDNGAITGSIVRPPDPQLAVGPDHVFEMINIVGRIYSRTGATLQSFSLVDFFAVPSGYRDTDPKVIYDALSGRWFASYVSFRDLPGPRNDEGRLHLAISQTSDPTGVWNVYDRSYSEVFPDYAGIAVTNDKFTISSNIFDIDQPFYFGEETVVIEKADVLAGVADDDVGRFAFPFNLDRFTVRPAHALSPVNDQYLVTRSRTSSTTLTVIRITGTPDGGDVSEAAATDLTIISQTAPPNSATAGGGDIDSGDQRLLDAMWRDGSLWASASAACVPAGDSTTRSCAHLIEVATTSPPPSIAQDIMFGAANEYFSWPSVRTDASGDVYVSVTHTNSTIFAEARAAGRAAGEPLNTMSGSALLRAGEVVYTGGRWGDYLAAAVDPNFPECVWLVGQYAKDTAFSSDWDWGTFVALTSYSGGTDSDSDGLDDPCDPDDDNDSLSVGTPLWLRDEIELFVGTDPLNPCADDTIDDNEADDKWPPDFSDDQAVNIQDRARMVSQILSGIYSQRFDLNADGVLNIGDRAIEVLYVLEFAKTGVCPSL